MKKLALRCLPILSQLQCQKLHSVGLKEDSILMSLNQNASFIYQLLPVSLVWTAIAPIGAFGNFLLILVIWKEKSFHSASHYLLQQKAVANLFSCIFFSGYGIRGIVAMVTPEVLLEDSTCCVLKISMHIGCLAVNTVLMLHIAVDRLVGICWPVYYRRIPQAVYYLSISVAWLSGLVHVLVALVYSADRNQLLPICVPPTAFVGDSLNFWNNWALAINVMVILLYSATIFKARLYEEKKRTSVTADTVLLESQMSARNRMCRKQLRALRSLTVIVIVYVFTWVTTMVIIKVLNVAEVNERFLLVAEVNVGGLAMADAVSDFPILIWRSRDYRRAVVKIFNISCHNMDLSQTVDRRSTPVDF